MKKPAPIFMTLLALASMIAFSGCASQQLADSQQSKDGANPDTAERYVQIIEKYSAGDSEYNGPYNKFEYRAVLLNHPVREAQIRHQTRYYQWDTAKVNVEEERARKELATETHVFLSFFTPDRNNDNLTTPKSIWRIYLDAGGRRYEGSIKRLRNPLAELQALYPAHVRWTTPYEVTFPAPADSVEAQSSKFTVTGPLGTKTVDFPAVAR